MEALSIFFRAPMKENVKHGTAPPGQLQKPTRQGRQNINFKLNQRTVLIITILTSSKTAHRLRMAHWFYGMILFSYLIGLPKSSAACILKENSELILSFVHLCNIYRPCRGFLELECFGVSRLLLICQAVLYYIDCQSQSVSP